MKKGRKLKYEMKEGINLGKKDASKKNWKEKIKEERKEGDMEERFLCRRNE